jgi:hypothetical protein
MRQLVLKYVFQRPRISLYSILSWITLYNIAQNVGQCIDMVYVVLPSSMIDFMLLLTLNADISSFGFVLKSTKWENTQLLIFVPTIFRPFWCIDSDWQIIPSKIYALPLRYCRLWLSTTSYLLRIVRVTLISIPNCATLWNWIKLNPPVWSPAANQHTCTRVFRQLYRQHLVGFN